MYKFLWIVLICGLCIVSSAFADDVIDHYRKGLELADAGELEAAIQELQSAVQAGDADVEVYMALGILSEKTGKNSEALEALLHAEEISPSQASVQFALALLYEKLDLPEKAISTWKRFIPLSKDSELIQLAKRHIRFLEVR